MRTVQWLFTVIGLANAAALVPRDAPPSGAGIDSASSWRPKTHNPEFFTLKVDDRCDGSPTDKSCPFQGYAVRLQDGIVIATRPTASGGIQNYQFSSWTMTPRLTQSARSLLQLYVNTVTGALKYAPVGWLPANSVAISFYKTGNNPLGKVDPSPAYFAWPSTEGRTEAFTAGTWWLCPLSTTGQYQVFISSYNFGASREGGVSKDGCEKESLAAINANPWI